MKIIEDNMRGAKDRIHLENEYDQRDNINSNGRSGHLVQTNPKRVAVWHMRWHSEMIPQLIKSDATDRDNANSGPTAVAISWCPWIYGNISMSVVAS